MAIIDEQIQENQTQLDRLLDLYLSGDFPKEVLMERKDRLEQISEKLLEERKEVDPFEEELIRCLGAKRIA